MKSSLALQLLEAHHPPARRSPAVTEEAWELRVDHVAFGQAAGALVAAALDALEIDRPAAEQVLVCLGRGGVPPGFEHSREVQRLVGAARRIGAHVARAGTGRCDPIYRDRFGAPGKLVLSAGEACASSGALGMLALSSSELEVAAVLAGVPLHRPFRPPVLVELRGGLVSWVSGLDLALEIERRISPAQARDAVLELAGEGVRSLSMADRIALASRCGDRWAAAVLFPSDEVTHAYLKALGRDADWKPLDLDPTTRLEPVASVDLDRVEPMMVRTDVEAVARPVRHAMGNEVRRVVIGPQATHADLARVAAILGGRMVHPELELIVLAGSRTAVESAAESGVMDSLVAAGARVIEGEVVPRSRSITALPPAGLCFGCTPGGLADERVWYVTSAETCAASALAGRLADPRELDVPFEPVEEPERHAGPDRLILKPGVGEPPAEVRGDRPGVPAGRPLDRPLRGVVLIKLEGRVSGEDLLVWGPRQQPDAARIEALAGLALAGLDAEFARRARRYGGGFVIAGRDFGAPPQREQAALILVELGVRAVLARSFDPEFRDRLVRVGVLPMRLGLEGDARAIAAGDELEVPGLPESLEIGKPLVVRNLTRGTQHTLPHDLDAHAIGLLRAGGLLALARER